MNDEWRLIQTDPLPAALNMAVDEMLMHTVAQGRPPVVRFYGWRPAALSLGYAQDAERDVDHAACAQLGIELVRRPTGGRAVLHDAEVTYSLIIPHDHPVIPPGIGESYRVISHGLTLGLIRLGVDAQMVPAKPVNPPQGGLRAACFAAPARHEVAAGGKKLVGSAQWRSQGVVLQHGSILIELNTDTLFACLKFASAAARRRSQAAFAASATSITDALGRSVTFSEVALGVTAGLQEALQLRLCPDEISPAEWTVARALAERKYSRLDWNQHIPPPAAQACANPPS